MEIAILNWPMTRLDPARCGGVERVALSIRESLERRGVEATLTVAGFDGGGKPAWLDVVRDTRVLRRLTFPLYYRRFLRRHGGAQVLHGHNAPLLAALAPERTLVWFGNEVRLDLFRVWEGRYRRARYAFDSAFLLRKFREAYPSIPEERCFLLSNAVDTGLFRPGEREGGSPRRALFVGQWNVAKGIDLLLASARIAHRRGARWELLLAGSPRLWGSRTDEPEAARIEAAVAACAREVPTLKVVGPVDYADLPALYRRADLCVVPSVWDDPAPSVALQAMAAGLPVVAFRRGGLPGIIGDGETGVLCGSETPEALDAAVDRLLGDDGALRRMGENARARAVERFSWEAHMEALMAIYARILEGGA
ncbi:MAG: glycosyltransferase family 4 protein [Planctomycetes bacterium]|nr:glycosyltransferase family 4 protein [Planctomycetota bacterium]